MLVSRVGRQECVRRTPVSLSDSQRHELRPFQRRRTTPRQAAFGRRASARRWSCSAGCRAATTFSAALSFGQDPRWRRALVGAVAPAPGRARARRGDRHGDGRRRAARALRRLHGRRPRPERADARGRARALRRRRSRGARRRARPSGCRSPTTALRRADVHLPAALRRRSAGDAARARTRGQAGRSRRLAGVRRAAALAARVAWRFYTAVGLPVLGRLASREWAEVGRFLGPSIRGYYARHPLARIVDYWREAG